MTRLTRAVRRESDSEYRGRPLVVTLHPGDPGRQEEPWVEIREKGRRLGAVAPLGWLYLQMTKRNVESRLAAKKAARKKRGR